MKDQKVIELELSDKKSRRHRYLFISICFLFCFVAAGVSILLHASRRESRLGYATDAMGGVYVVAEPKQDDEKLEEEVYNEAFNLYYESDDEHKELPIESRGDNAGDYNERPRLLVGNKFTREAWSIVMARNNSALIKQLREDLGDNSGVELDFDSLTQLNFKIPGVAYIGNYSFPSNSPFFSQRRFAPASFSHFVKYTDVPEDEIPILVKASTLAKIRSYDFNANMRAADLGAHMRQDIEPVVGQQFVAKLCTPAELNAGAGANFTPNDCAESLKLRIVGVLPSFSRADYFSAKDTSFNGNFYPSKQLDFVLAWDTEASRQYFETKGPFYDENNLSIVPESGLPVLKFANVAEADAFLKEHKDSDTINYREYYGDLLSRATIERRSTLLFDIIYATLCFAIFLLICVRIIRTSIDREGGLIIAARVRGVTYNDVRRDYTHFIPLAFVFCTIVFVALSFLFSFIFKGVSASLDRKGLILNYAVNGSEIAIQTHFDPLFFLPAIYILLSTIFTIFYLGRVLKNIYFGEAAENAIAKRLTPTLIIEQRRQAILAKRNLHSKNKPAKLSKSIEAELDKNYSPNIKHDEE